MEPIIQCAVNLDVFSPPKNQRPIYEPHVRSIAERIHKFGFLPMYPVVIDKDFRIIDGQHRVEAARREKSCVYYIMVDEEISSADIAYLAGTVAKWTPKDYVWSYASAGVRTYQRLKEFCEINKMSVSAALQLLNEGAREEYHVERFRRGEYNPTEERWIYARTIASRCDDFAEFIGRGATQDVFITAVRWMSSLPHYDHEQMRKRLGFAGGSLKRASLTMDYVRQLVYIYNLHSKTARRITVDEVQAFRGSRKHKKKEERENSPF